MVSRDCCVALPRGAMRLPAVCDCGISWSYSLTIFAFSSRPICKTLFSVSATIATLFWQNQSKIPVRSF